MSMDHGVPMHKLIVVNIQLVRGVRRIEEVGRAVRVMPDKAT
jgi:hypothetical protein